MPRKEKSQTSSTAVPSTQVSASVGQVLGAELHESMTVSKHRKIAKAATEVFIAKGYTSASVDEIAVQAGVAKQTIYKHFSNKERLFLAVSMAATDAITGELAAQLNASRAGTTDFATELAAFARTLARMVLTPEITALRRLVMNEVTRFPALGRSWYEHGPGRVVEQLTRRFRELDDQGLLSIDDPERAAEDFNWLVLASAQNKMLFGAVKSFTVRELDAVAAHAVDVFIAAYSTDKRGG
jgi:TetR/AcrR family transcriptional regulator, mexJK operon transcriptional repressor